MLRWKDRRSCQDGGATRPPRLRELPSDLLLFSGPDAETLARSIRDVDHTRPIAELARERQRTFDATAPLRAAVVDLDDVTDAPTGTSVWVQQPGRPVRMNQEPQRVYFRAS